MLKPGPLMGKCKSQPENAFWGWGTEVLGGAAHRTEPPAAAAALEISDRCGFGGASEGDENRRGLTGGLALAASRRAARALKWSEVKVKRSWAVMKIRAFCCLSVCAARAPDQPRTAHWRHVQFGEVPYSPALDFVHVAGLAINLKFENILQWGNFGDNKN